MLLDLLRTLYIAYDNGDSITDEDRAEIERVLKMPEREVYRLAADQLNSTKPKETAPSASAATSPVSSLNVSAGI